MADTKEIEKSRFTFVVLFASEAVVSEPLEHWRVSSKTLHPTTEKRKPATYV